MLDYLIFILLPIICAAVVYMCLRGGDMSKQTALAILVGFPVLSLGLYLVIGSPFIPAAPAALETSGPAFEKRQLALQERAILSEMAASDNTPPLHLFLKLADIQTERGQPASAIDTLKRAQAIYPENKLIDEAMGYSFYIKGLKHRIDGDEQAARKAFEKAKEKAPEDADYLHELILDMKK